ncbi:MAG: dTMP kinase [Deltaproteobacteria bacterium]|nr:dTMP kinase [Deltaproteobacteria bacterium]MDL1960766.1 dTMP kinase [Deltaproteobacteria bacterium]
MRSCRHNPHGFFVVVEGIDGTGKTTLARNIYIRLRKRGFPAIFTFEPTDGLWGEKLRRSFSAPGRLTPKEELELFLKDRKEHVEKIIRPSLERKKIVVCDRYYFSTMAYQGARGLDPEAIRKTNETFAPIPDLVLLLELDPEAAIKRIRESRGEVPDNFEQLAYLKKVIGIFKSLSDPFVVCIDATLPPEELLNSAWNLISDLLN